MDYRKSITTGILFIALLCVTLLSPFIQSAHGQKYGGTLRVGIRGDTKSDLDPHAQRGELVRWTSQQIYESLARERNDGTIESMLSERWEQLNHGKIWIFSLRRGVNFHDGSDWDAEAFRWNLERIMAPETKSHVVGLDELIAEIVVLDKYTCKVLLKKPDYFILRFLQDIKFISPTVVKKYGEAWFNYPAGTGPFMFDHRDLDGTTTLKRNPDYWKIGVPYLDALIFKPYETAESRHQALVAGEIDAEPLVDFAYYLPSTKDPSLSLSLAPISPCSLNLAANLTMAPWDDVRVRKAILGYALDRQRVCERVFMGLAKPKINPGSAAHPYCEDLQHLYPFDLQKARELLQEAGIIGEEIQLTVSDGFPAFADIGEILKSDLAEIGVRITLKKAERVRWIRSFYVDHEIPFSIAMNCFNDPAGWFRHLGPASSLNPTQAGTWMDQGKTANQDPELFRLLQEASKAMQEPQREEAFQRLIRHITENAYYVGIVSLPLFHNFRQGIKGYEWRLLNVIFDTVYFE